jgi:hypothetical protein
MPSRKREKFVIIDFSLGMPGLGWRKAGEKISKGDQRIIFEIFPPNIKGVSTYI